MLSRLNNEYKKSEIFKHVSKIAKLPNKIQFYEDKNNNKPIKIGVPKNT